MIFYKKREKKQQEKKSNKKVLPVNCNRMIDCWCMPFDLWLSLSTNWRGTRYGTYPGLGQGQAEGPFFPKKRSGLFSKLSLITLQPKKQQSFFSIVTSTAKPMLSLLMLHTHTWNLSLIFNVIYAPLCYVDVCQCAYVCVCVRIYRMCSSFCSGLALSRLLVGLCPCDVMTCSAQEWESQRAAPLVSVSLRVPSFLRERSSFLCFFRAVHPKPASIGFNRDWLSLCQRVWAFPGIGKRDCFFPSESWWFETLRQPGLSYCKTKFLPLKHGSGSCPLCPPLSLHLVPHMSCWLMTLPCFWGVSTVCRHSWLHRYLPFYLSHYFAMAVAPHCCYRWKVALFIWERPEWTPPGSVKNLMDCGELLQRRFHVKSVAIVQYGRMTQW